MPFVRADVDSRAYVARIAEQVGPILFRLSLAAQADLCLAIYNPASHRRADYLKRACEILLRHISPETVCGAVRNIAREGESARLMTLAQLRDYEADMFTTVFIGNERTREIEGRMVTPRGYKDV